jgi:hypothetical protein
MEQAIVSQHWVAMIAASMRELGVSRACCRYDGGNDEGFAWLDHVELADGSRLNAETLSERLAQTALYDRLISADLTHGRTPTKPQLMNGICETFAIETAALLLGQGFGTGPYYLYGAFTVDLTTRAITDDHNAEPVTGNINLAT